VSDESSLPFFHFRTGVCTGSVLQPAIPALVLYFLSFPMQFAFPCCELMVAVYAFDQRPKIGRNPKSSEIV
jgi:hypothetical protein